MRAIQIAICIALFSLSPGMVSGQNTLKTDSILLAEALDLFDNRKYSAAISKANEAAAGFIQQEEWERVVDCQSILVQIEYLEVFPENLLPDIEYIHRLIPDSLELEKAISSYNIAYIADEKGDILKALKHYQASIKAFKKHEEWVYLSWVYINNGVIYTQFGDYSRARKYLNASADMMLQTQDSFGYSYNILNLATNAFYENNYQESENLFQKYQGLEPYYSDETYVGLCGVKTAKMELDSARIYLNLARKSKKKYDTPSSVISRLNADILCAEGDIEGAISEMIKSEQEVDNLDNIRERGKYYWRIGDLYSRNEDWDKAENYFEKSLQAFSKFEIKIDSNTILKQKKNIFYEIWLGDILIGLSNVYKAKNMLYHDENFKSKFKDILDLALESLDYKRSVFEDVESSINLNKSSKSIYEKIINLYLDWYEKSGLEIELDKAFQIAQRHNAFVLRQQINERTILDRFEVDDALKKEYLNLKVQAAEQSVKIGKQFSKEGFEQLQKKEFTLDSMKQKMALEYPQLESSRYDFNVSNVSEIQRSLSRDRAVIKYFEGENNLYAFVITKKEISYFVHPNVEEISADILRLRSILSDFSSERSNLDSIEREYLLIAHKLGKTIISKELASLAKSIKKLTIIPSGTLTRIPFETLIINEKKTWQDPNHYLINDYAISYNYFCKALTSQTINKELKKVLAYGLEYDDYTLNASKKLSNDSLSSQIIEKFRSEEMGHLYSADEEADEVAEIFDGVSFVNEYATKRNFLSNVSEYDIIHLSAHSFVDYQYPSNSAIIFTKKDSLTDNLLRIKDVDRLVFDGQLFTLSACNTFFGKSNEGEGLSSIARSFIQSGAGSVVGSFWSVPDEISKSFMVRFYSKLKDGMPKDEALRATKIDFMTDDKLSSPLYRSPAYWSAWVLFGDTQSINRSKNQLLYFGIGLICICILVLIKFKFSGRSGFHK